jgi:hypothetical protein
MERPSNTYRKSRRYCRDDHVTSTLPIHFLTGVDAAGAGLGGGAGAKSHGRGTCKPSQYILQH